MKKIYTIILLILLILILLLFMIVKNNQTYNQINNTFIYYPYKKQNLPIYQKNKKMIFINVDSNFKNNKILHKSIKFWKNNNINFAINNKKHSPYIIKINVQNKKNDNIIANIQSQRQLSPNKKFWIYVNTKINLYDKYQHSSNKAKELILTHELGHALGLNDVHKNKNIMNYSYNANNKKLNTQQKQNLMPYY